MLSTRSRRKLWCGRLPMSTDMCRRSCIKIPLISLAILLIIAASCTSGDERDQSHEMKLACLEARLADGTGFRTDAAMVIALSRAIAKAHPELDPIVGAVADHLKDNPVRRGIHLDDLEGTSPVVEVLYMLTLTNLAARPHLATPEVLDAITQAAENRPLGGMGQISRLILGDDVPQRELGGEELGQLTLLVNEQYRAIEEAGIEELPSPTCPPPEE